MGGGKAAGAESQRAANDGDGANRLLAGFLKDRLLGPINEDVDIVVFSDQGQRFGTEPCVARRRRDHSVRHLPGVEPPFGEEFTVSASPPIG